MRAALQAFRIAAPEFDSKPDEEVLARIQMYTPLVGRRVFGDDWPQAIAYYTAHMMTLAEVAKAEGASSGAIGNVKSKTENKLSITFGDISSTRIGDDLLSRTLYGQLFLQLRSMHVLGVKTRMG